MADCGCGMPNRANFALDVTVGREVEGGTETDTVFIYACARHMPPLPPGEHSLMHMSHEDIATIKGMFRFDGHEQWYVLAYELTELR